MEKYKSDPIGLPQKYCKTIVNQLNEDIASSCILFLQLRKQHAMLSRSKSRAGTKQHAML